MTIRLASAALVLGALLGAAKPAAAGSVELPVQVGGAFSVPVRSLNELRFAATLRQEHDFSCGSAALATLLTHHYQRPVTERAVFDDMLARGDRARIAREGFSLLDMKRYLQAHGFEADGFEAPLASLVEAHVPAIALVARAGVRHFVVVKGLRDGRVLVGDPARGTRVMTQEAFEAERVDRILFVIGNHLDDAGFNLAADWQAAPAAPLGAGTRAAADGLPGLPGRGGADL